MSLQVYLGLGSNLQPDHHIPLALDALRSRFGPLRVSSWYHTRALRFDGPDFINLAVEISVDELPEEVVDACAQIERQIGRRREQEKGCGSRCIDIDLLLFSGDSDRPLPPPREDIWLYAYAAVPLAELIPDWRHAALGPHTLASFVDRGQLEDQGVVRARDPVRGQTN